jgi:hypothetical protein
MVVCPQGAVLDQKRSNERVPPPSVEHHEGTNRQGQQEESDAKRSFSKASLEELRPIMHCSKIFE